jgi:hypothetical protein
MTDTVNAFLPATLAQGTYIIAALLFILALAGLSKHESAKGGNTYGIYGMALAILITIVAAVGGIDYARNTADLQDRSGSGMNGILFIAVAMAHRRRRHAGGGVDAEQLLRLGGGGIGLRSTTC